MRKILLVLVSVLLIAGSVYAVDMEQSVTAEYSAQNNGRSVATGESVIIKVWGKDGVTTQAGVGISSSSALIIYSDYVNSVGYVINPSSSYDTVGEIVDYINTNFSSDSSVTLYASVGRDAYRDMNPWQLIATNIATAGVTKDTAAVVYGHPSRVLSAGAEANNVMAYRVKSIESALPFRLNTASSTNGITLSVWDGNTRVWRKYLPNQVYNGSTAVGASSNTVKFPDAKGLSLTKGNSFCVTAESDATMDSDTPASNQAQVSVVYDLFKN